jgi:hypothetical protein
MKSKEKTTLRSYEIKSIIKETSDCLITLAVNKSNGEKVFVKSPKSKIGEQAINREFNNQKFFCRLAEIKDCGFQLLPVSMDEKLLVYPDISEQVNWLGEPRSETTISPKNELINAYLGNYLKLQRVIREIEFNDLPQPIKDDWQIRKNNWLKNYKKDSDYLLKRKLISKKIIEVGKNLIEKFKNKGALQHHDIVPWHIGRRKDGQQILVDAGWSVWSLKYYDFAYSALQLIGYADQVKDAKILLAAAEKEYGHEQNFDTLLKTALVYRGIRLVKELHEAKFRSWKKVLEFIKSY